MSRRRQKQQSGWVMVFLFIMLFLAVAYVLFNRQGEAAPPAEGAAFRSTLSTWARRTPPW